MNRPRHNWSNFLFPAAGIAYPFLVYAFLDRVPAWCFLAVLVATAALRLILARKRVGIWWTAGFVGSGVVLGGVALRSVVDAVKVYPVLTSLAMATAFGVSLAYPPTLAERVARLTHPDLPEAGVRYTRKVSWVWFVFLLSNAAVAAWTAAFGTLGQWTLWNGLISYLLMGFLFVGEFFIRKAILP